MRLFFALQPDPLARHALAKLASDVAQVTGGKSPTFENLHVTMAFLGEVAPERLAEVESIGARSAQSTAPFALAFERIGMFRGSGIAWTAPGSKPTQLVALFESLRAHLQDGQFRVDAREFHPHVTLARHCKRPLGKILAPSIEFRVESLVLMMSETRPEGARYRELASYALTAR